MFFDKSWKEVSCFTFKLWSEMKKVYLSSYRRYFFQEIPKDKTGDFDMIYGFLRENWNIVRWVALGIVIFEVSKN